MVSAGLQLLTLFWKNAKNQHRQKAWTILECVLPIIFAVITVVVRQLVQSTDHGRGVAYPPMTVQSLLFWPNKIAYFPRNADTDRIMSRAAQLMFGCELMGPNMTLLKRANGVCPEGSTKQFQAYG